jgi:ADP-ribose pyrophosphatase
METLFEGKHLRLVRAGSWEYVQRRGVDGVVVLVALTNDQRLLLVEQFRPPVSARVLELPAGLAGDLGPEELEAAAARELEEETGWRAGRLERLTRGPASAGLSDELLTVFRATDLQPVGPGGGDASEDIQVHAVPLREVRAFLLAHQAAGGLVDLKVWAGLAFLPGDSG